MHWPTHVARPGCFLLLGGLLLIWGAGCTSDNDDSRGGGKGSAEQCPPLTSQEVKDLCNKAFTDCLETPIQSIWGEKFNHSQCINCRNVCTQEGGIWPAQADGLPCQ
jgi:hypothetical protein